MVNFIVRAVDDVLKTEFCEPMKKKSFSPTTDGLGNVYINDGQYFEGVPLAAWEFYIGGYQPAQKWLKDRKGADYNNGEGLTFDDRMHYRKIIHILVETGRIMKTIKMDL